MRTDRAAVLDWLLRAEEGLLAASHAVESAEDEMGSAGRPFGVLALKVENVRHDLVEARKALRGLAGQVRLSVPSEDVQAG